MIYETVWDGSMRDVYLCIPPVRVTTVEIVPGEITEVRKQRWSSRNDIKADLLRLLPQQPEWEIADLIERIGCERAAVYGLLYHMKVAKTVISRRHGTVSWRGVIGRGGSVGQGVSK